MGRALPGSYGRFVGSIHEGQAEVRSLLRRRNGRDARVFLGLAQGPMPPLAGQPGSLGGSPMLHKLRSRAANQDGFTLIELLVVILIIGILAAIALPTFLGQRSKGQDASSKSDARNLVSQVESCYATEQTYVNCDSNRSSAVAVPSPPVSTTAPARVRSRFSAAVPLRRRTRTRSSVTRSLATTSRLPRPPAGAITRSVHHHQQGRLPGVRQLVVGFLTTPGSFVRGGPPGPPRRMRERSSNGRLAALMHSSGRSISTLPA